MGVDERRIRERPEMLTRLQFRGMGRQEMQIDVFGHLCGGAGRSVACARSLGSSLPSRVDRMGGHSLPADVPGVAGHVRYNADWRCWSVAIPSDATPSPTAYGGAHWYPRKIETPAPSGGGATIRRACAIPYGRYTAMLLMRRMYVHLVCGIRESVQRVDTFVTPFRTTSSCACLQSVLSRGTGRAGGVRDSSIIRSTRTRMVIRLLSVRSASPVAASQIGKETARNSEVPRLQPGASMWHAGVDRDGVGRR